MTIPKDPVKSITEMLPQSMSIISAPSVSNFERYERRGGVREAATYVVLAAVVAALISGVSALMPWHEVSFIGAFLAKLVGIPLSFFAFTGLAYLIGKILFRGTGSYDEVAYTFALFFVPLSIAISVLALIPVVGFLAGWLISFVIVYFGYIAIQSSMNIRDTIAGVVTLVLSWLAYRMIEALVVALFSSI